MTGADLLDLEEVEKRVCDIVAKQVGFDRKRVSPGLRMIEDLHIDSLDVIELLMEVEESLGVTLPENAPNPVYKAVFTRQPFRIADPSWIGPASLCRSSYRRGRPPAARGRCLGFRCVSAVP
jgi:acyl carrier protein